MSEIQDKDESPVTDSQETYYEKSQNMIDNSQMLSESQDFALIVGEDSDESTKNQSQVIQNIQTDEKPVEKNFIEAERQAINNGQESTTCEIEKETLNVLTQVIETKKDEIIENLNKEDAIDNAQDGISEDKRVSDEDEIIQGTPPEISSPSRKLLSGKRRGESFDEPASKIQRTLPQRDALKLEKESLAIRAEKACIDYKLILSNISGEKRETQSDIICKNTENFDTNEESDQICATQKYPKNIVIAETQDSEDSEPILFGDVSDNVNKDFGNKPPETDEKDKTSLDNSRLETTDNKPEDNEKEDPQSMEEIVSKTPENLSEATTNGKKDDDDKIVEENKTDEVMNVENKDLAEDKIINNEESIEKKKDSIHSTDKEFSNAVIPSSDSASDSNCEAGSNNSNKSRKSIEVIYDRKSTSQEKKKSAELVTIDEDGDEIVLDSSQEEGEKIILDSSTEEVHLRFSTGSSNNSPQNTTVYKSCMDSKTNSESSSYKSTLWNETCKANDRAETADCQLTNGEEEGGVMSGTTKTVSSGSDQLVDDLIPDAIKSGTSKSTPNDSDMDERFNLSSKLSDSMELANVVSDSEGDSLIVNDNVENKCEDKASISSNTSVAPKMTVYENKIRFQIELKYLVHVDDNTKDIVYKEITDVHCDSLREPSHARRNSDTSGCLADISGNANKDTSPGSVLSNPQFFTLSSERVNTRISMSSTSSASSAASLAVRALRDPHFPLPRGRAKHAKRPIMEAVSEEKLNSSETFEKLTEGWKNANMITDIVLQTANMVINSPEIYQPDNETGKKEDTALSSSTPEPGSTEENVLASTPEPVQDERVTSQLATPKSTKDKKPLKRIRTKSNNGTARSGAKRKASPEVITTSQEDRLPIIKRKRENIEPDNLLKEEMVSTPSKVKPGTPRLRRSSTPQNLFNNDESVGKIVFAKWSDNNYYPGEVTERVKGKFRVKFYDGKSKLLIEEFVIPIPQYLRDGLSVFATTKENDYYGSDGIIVRSENVNNVMIYTVEMDKGNRVKVQIKDIFLTPDQAQVIKDDGAMDSKSLPKTPQRLDKVSLYNLVDGKRRPPVTPTDSTPNTRKRNTPGASRTSDSTTASGSGITKMKGKTKEILSSESESKTSDSNVSSMEDVDGVQPELVTMPAVQISKGPPSRVKGRGGRTKSKQNQDDIELGPIPPASSTIFKNMSFILTSTSLDIISRHQTDDSCSEAGTENEEEWLRTPFVKERVKKQLINGGGTVYDSFKQIPPNEYKNTKLITNVPNLTAKSIQCLSVGISAYSHNWVIHSCRENKALKPSQYELPAGYCLEKKTYIESYNRNNKQPFNGMIIGMPTVDNRNVANRSIEFWTRICENAGAGVEKIVDSETDFSHATAILTDNRCPSWLVEKADSWQIPLVSTVWIVQCMIAGQSLVPDSHPQYKHTFIQS